MVVEKDRINLQQVEAWLTAEHKRLTGSMDGRRAELRSGTEVGKSEDGLYVEYFSEADVVAKVGDVVSKELRKVVEALERVKKGSYGTCTICGEEIAPARLMARPYAIRCIRCQREEEEQSGSRA